MPPYSNDPLARLTPEERIQLLAQYGGQQNYRRELPSMGSNLSYDPAAQGAARDLLATTPSGRGDAGAGLDFRGRDPRPGVPGMNERRIEDMNLIRMLEDVMRQGQYGGRLRR